MVGILVAIALAAGPPGRAVELNRTGTQASQGGDYATALGLYEQAVELEPKNELFLSNAAAAAWWLKKNDLSVRYFRRAAEAAAADGGFDRVGVYQHRMMQVRYVMPPGAAEARAAASQLPDTDAARAGLERFSALYAEANAAVARRAPASAHDAAKEAAQVGEAAFGAGHPNTLAAMNLLGEALRGRGQGAEAAKVYARVVRGARRALGDDHPDVLVYLNNLASAHELAAELPKARKTFERVVKQSRKILGPSHPITATYLINLSRMLIRAKRFARALALIDQAVRIKTEAFGPEHPDTLAAEKAAADLAAGYGEVGNAVERLDRAHGHARRLMGPSNPFTQELSEALIGLLETLARAEEVTPLLEQDLADAAAAAGADSVGAWVAATRLAQHLEQAGEQRRARDLYARTLGSARRSGAEAGILASLMNNLGLAQQRLGHYAEAEKLYAEAVAGSVLASASADDPETLYILNNQALLHSELGRYESALRLYERLWRIRRKTLPASDPDRLRSRFNLGMLHLKMGRLDAARRLVAGAARGREKALGPEHPETLSAYNGLGVVQQSAGSYEAAQAAYERALKGREKVLGPKHSDTLITLNNLGLLYHHQGRAQKAYKALKRVLEVRRETLGDAHPLVASAINDLANLAQSAGQFDEAQQLLEVALSRSVAALGEEHPDTIKVRSNLAHALSGRGKHAQALAISERVLADARKHLPENHPDTAIYMGNVAGMYERAGKRDRARALHEVALQIKELVLGKEHPETLVTLGNLAVLQMQMGELAKADRLWRRLSRGTNRFLRTVLWGADAVTRQTWMLDRRFLDALYLSYWLDRDTAETGPAVYEHVLERKGLLVHLAAQVQRLARVGRRSKEAAPIVAELEVLRRSLANRVLRPTAAGAAGDLQARIDDAEARLGRLTGGGARGRIAVSDVVARVPADAALVDYQIYMRVDTKTLAPVGMHLAAVVLRRGRAPVTVRLGPMAPIARAVERLRAELREPEKTLDEEDLAAELYRFLVAPILPATGGAKHLLLVPHGPLHMVPFGVLADGSRRRLIQTHRLSLLTSGRDLVASRRSGRRRKPAPPTVIAAPTYGEGAPEAIGAAFEALPGAEREGAEVAALLGGAGLLARDSATESAVMAMDGPRILHFATHGFFLPVPKAAAAPGAAFRGTRSAGRATSSALEAAPVDYEALARSGLALAGANGGGEDDDGILTALEVLSLNLSGTELVVLSACETGLGVVAAGQGVYGLRRAFQEAGARAVLSTLWAVDDEATRVFMHAFYKRVLDGASPGDALRAVQLEMAGGRKWSDPFYWAPFTLVGLAR